MDRQGFSALLELEVKTRSSLFSFLLQSSCNAPPPPFFPFPLIMVDSSRSVSKFPPCTVGPPSSRVPPSPFLFFTFIQKPRSPSSLLFFGTNRHVSPCSMCSSCFINAAPFLFSPHVLTAQQDHPPSLFFPLPPFPPRDRERIYGGAFSEDFLPKHRNCRGFPWAETPSSAFPFFLSPPPT